MGGVTAFHGPRCSECGTFPPGGVVDHPQLGPVCHDCLDELEAEDEDRGQQLEDDDALGRPVETEDDRG